MNPISVLSVVVKASGISRVNAELAGLQGTARKAASAASEAEAMTGKMGGAGKAAAAGMGAAAAGARKGESAFKKFGARGSITLGHLRAFGPVGALAGAAAVSMGVQFNDSMQRIVALVGVSQKQVNAWKKDLLALAPAVGKSPKELADALYFLTSSGLSGSQAMDALKISAKASAAGLGDMTTIADAVSSAMNAYGAKTMSAAKATDILVATAKAGKAEPEELAKTMGRVLPIASQLGVTFNDVGGAVASMSLKGLDAAESVTAVRQMLQALIKPSLQGKKVLGEYGLSLDEIQKSLREKGLLSTLVMLRERFHGNTQDLAKLFNGVEGFNGVLSLTTNGGRQAAGVFDQVQHSTGLTAKAFDESKTTGFRFRQALALASDAGVILANQLAALVGFFDRNRTALSVLLVVVGALAAGWVAYNVAQGAVAITTGLLTGEMWGLTAAIRANPIAAIIGLLIALGAALVIAYQRSATFRAIVDGAFRAVGAAASWLAGVWSSLVAVAVAVFGSIAHAVIVAWGAVRTATVAVWGVVAAVTSSVWHGIAAALTAVWAVIYAVLRVYTTFWRELITSCWNVVKEITLAVWGALRPYLAAVWGAIRAVASSVFGAIRSLISGAWHGVEAVTRAVWGVLRGFLVGEWGTIHALASAAWQGIRSVIVRPVGGMIDQIKGLIGHGGKDKTGLVGWLSGAWDTITKGAADFGNAFKDTIVGAFKGVVGTILHFAIDILNILGKIPGVDFGGTIKNLKNVGKGLKIDGFAQGGAFARTGGLVNSPITLMGEEAPRHPEFVIPTNPAYRGRAQKLLGMAAGALGFAKGGMWGPATLALASGGVLSFDAVKALWTSQGGREAAANTMAWISTAESGRNPLVNYGGHVGRIPGGGTRIAAGLYQILGLPFPGDVYDAATNTRMAIAKSSNGRNLHPWDSSRATWGPHVGQDTPHGGGGILGAIGGAISKVGGAVGHLLSQGAGWIIDQLPGVDKLPDWLKGTGTQVLHSVIGWIKDKVGSLLGSVGIGGGGGLGKPGGGGLGTFDGLPVANWIIPELNWARKHGWKGHITSGYRDPNRVIHSSMVAPQGHSNHNFTAYPGGAIDVGSPSDRADGAALWNVIAAYQGARKLVWGGPTIGDWGHFSATGHKTGGVFTSAPFVGAYKNGGRVPADGFAYVHKDEEITPAGRRRGGGDVIVEGDLIVRDETDATRIARELAWAIG